MDSIHSSDGKINAMERDSINHEINRIPQTEQKHFQLNEMNWIKERERILKEEEGLWIGREVTLNESEKKVDAFILALKMSEIHSALNTSYFPLAKSFLTSKAQIDDSLVFKIIRKFPKGAILHIHDLAMLDVDWLIKNATYRPNCYMCTKGDNSNINFRFSIGVPETLEGSTTWKLVSEERRKSDNLEKFDERLADKLTFSSQHLLTDTESIWERFEACLWGASGLVYYSDVLPDYIYEALRRAREDSVQLIEIRAYLKEVYDISGVYISKQDVIDIYRATSNKFVKDYPDCMGVKIIEADIRIISPDNALNMIKQGVELRKENSDIYVGFDLQGQEDVGRTLLYYKDSLLYPAEHGVNLPFFFHAGETDYFGTQTDANLTDAVLLNTVRIGHAFSLPKHPRLRRIVKQRQIAIEVNPISNQILGYVSDLRNHPMTALMADNYPIIISSDDPAVWKATPLSHDFYAAFLAMSAKGASLCFLKQLALNSIKFSALTAKEKVKAMALWREKWDHFIQCTICEHDLKDCSLT